MVKAARSVAIIGGGIGGLTAANTLIRAGMSVSLYERSPYFIPTAGAGFGLQPNGQTVLSYLGFKEKTEKIVHPFFNWQIINDNGDVVRTSHRIAKYGELFGYYLGGALRSELVDILKEPLEHTDHIHYSHNVARIEQNTDSVTISFQNDKEQKPVQVDMLIGADGIHSTVVNQIFPQTTPPIYSKENIFYGIIDNVDEQKIINPSVTAKNTLTQYFGRGEFITYRLGRSGHLMWAATYPSDAPPTSHGDAEWTQMNTQRDLTQLLKRFPESHPIHQCATVTDINRILHFGLYYRQHRSDGWHRGRICLLGDSCHATLPYVGQGANMAMEDAVSLALCLEQHNFQTEPAFQEYYKRRFERTKRVVDMARYMGLFLHSENSIVHSIRQRLVPFIMQSKFLMEMAEKEFYNGCPVPIERKKVL